MPAKQRKLTTLISTAMIASTLALTACSGGVTATQSEAVKSREDIMKNWKDAMEVMGGMVKNPDTFDAAKFQQEAQFLAEDANNAWVHFHDANDVGGATSAVWDDANTFQSEVDRYKKATNDLNNAAQGASTVADIQPAFGAVSESCKSCHKQFKAPDE